MCGAATGERAKIMRQDLRIKRIFLPFPPPAHRLPARRGLQPGGMKGKKVYLFRSLGANAAREMNYPVASSGISNVMPDLIRHPG